MTSIRVFFKYTQEDLQHALSEVHDSKASKKAASQKYGIPRATLIRKLKGTVPMKRKMGKRPVLTEAEEMVLAKWVLGMARKGFPIRRTHLMASVKQILQEDGRETPFKDNLPGKKWFHGFMKRHPELTEKKAERVTKSRAAVTEGGIRAWFDEVAQEIPSDILEDPTRIFNADETGFMLCPKSGKVLGPKGGKEDFYVIEEDNSKKQITVMLAIQGNGNVLPPMIFPSYGLLCIFYRLGPYFENFIILFMIIACAEEFLQLLL